MIVLLYILFFIAALILILLVMIQDEQGEGIGGIFGGGSTTPFGSRAGNVLTRFTAIIAAVFLIVCVVIGLLNRSTERQALADQTKEESTKEKFFEPVLRMRQTTEAPEATNQLPNANLEENKQ